MERLKSVGWAGLCLAFCALFVWLWGTDLAREISHRNDTFLEARDVRMTSGKCSSKMFVISSCELKLREASGRETEKNYFMLGNYGGSNVHILRSAQDPTFLTTNMGRDQFWNRLLLMMLPIGLFGLGGLILLVKALRGRAAA